MSIFYIESANGDFYSADRTRRFIELKGKDAYEYLLTHPGLCFYKTETEDRGGENVFIEATKELAKEITGEKNRKYYNHRTLKERGIKILPLAQLVTCCDDLCLGSTIMSPYISNNVEDFVLHKIYLETLYRALRTLTDYEFKIIYALFLMDNPISERKLSRLLGVPQKTLNYRKKHILNKLKGFF